MLKLLSRIITITITIVKAAFVLLLYFFRVFIVMDFRTMQCKLLSWDLFRLLKNNAFIFN